MGNHVGYIVVNHRNTPQSLPLNYTFCFFLHRWPHSLVVCLPLQSDCPRLAYRLVTPLCSSYLFAVLKYEEQINARYLEVRLLSV